MFENYLKNTAYDEMFEKDGTIKEPWRDIWANLEKLDAAKLQEFQSQLDWIMEDNGVTFNIYSDATSASSHIWRLDPIPFVISHSEWSRIKDGIRQRAKLLNLLLKDIYSTRSIIKEEIIPAELLFSQDAFLKEVHNFGFNEDFTLHFYALDLARGPDGKMWVIGDRTESPSGLGYAIENRLAMNSVTKDLSHDVETKKLFYFLDKLKELVTPQDGTISALMTPGPYNETYFEHAYLSSFLDIKLVQGDDLLCKDGSLWLKNLGGLKKISTLLRRVDDKYCDPLELKNDSRLGVAGLTDALREESVKLLNPLGSAILENLAFNPFMEKLCQFFLGESLILPQIATWWCGQPKEMEFVLQNLSSLIIKSTDKKLNQEVYIGRNLNSKELEDLKKLIQETPYKFVAQEHISFSTTPYFENGTIEPRNSTIRAFALKQEEGYTVMNGGLVRVSSQRDALLVSSHKGSSSKDLWVLGHDEFIPQNLLPRKQICQETSLENLSTQKAQSLFWLGRYLARTITTIRFAIQLLKKSNTLDYGAVSPQDILQKAMTHLTMTYPGFFNEKKKYKEMMDELSSIIQNNSRIGSLGSTVNMLANTNTNLKDMLSVDANRLFRKFTREWAVFASKSISSNIVLASELEKMMPMLLAYKALVRESIYKEQGLLIVEIGYEIESVILHISLIRSTISHKMTKSAEYEVLEALLHSLESFNAYRIRYQSSLNLENILEFLIFNKQFPKSLTYLLNLLLLEFKKLPKSSKHLMPYEELLVFAKELIKSLDTASLLASKDEDAIFNQLDALMAKLFDYLFKCSDEISKRYFSHYGE